MKKIIDNLVIDIQRVKRTRFISGEWKSIVNVADSFSRLYYVKRGKAEIILNGTRKIMTGGNFYLLPSKAPLSFVKPKNIFDHYWMHFKTCLPGEICLFDFMKCPFELPQNQIQTPLKSFERLLELWEPENPGELLECKGLALLLLAPFVCAASNKPAAHENFIMIDKLRPVLNYMEENAPKPTTLKKLGKIAGMHPTYFSNTFKKHFGIPPLQYICRMRIMKAQEMLIGTEDSLQSIAFEVGYQDHCFFSRIFKKYTGVSPGKYRDMNRFE